MPSCHAMGGAERMGQTAQAHRVRGAQPQGLCASETGSDCGERGEASLAQLQLQRAVRCLWRYVFGRLVASLMVSCVGCRGCALQGTRLVSSYLLCGCPDLGTCFGASY
eukprot:2192318-Prymnesium_polylepis.1